jgi:Domain of unknown function (DUF4157)
MSRMAPLQTRAEAPKQMPIVQRSPEVAGRGPDRTGRFGAAPPIVNEVLSTPGKMLEPAAQMAMSARLRHDFSKVRVHADSRAAASARAVDATAYTVGSHVVFDDGKYEPRSAQGQHLLAHELIHTLQQSHALQWPKRSSLETPPLPASGRPNGWRPRTSHKSLSPRRMLSAFSGR